MLSHFGAVRADRNIPSSMCGIYDSSGKVWFDAGNRTYAFILEMMMGGDTLEEMNLSNAATLGDMLELFFGLCYFMGHPDNQRASEFRSQLESWNHLDAVVRYLYHNWDIRNTLFEV